MRTIYHTDWGSVISEKQILQNTRQEGLIVFHLLLNCLFSSHFLHFPTLWDAYNLKHLFKELQLDPSVAGPNPAVPTTLSSKIIKDQFTTKSEYLIGKCRFSAI